MGSRVIAPAEQSWETRPRRDVPAGCLVHVQAGTALQSVNHSDEYLVVYVHGWPPEDQYAELLASAV